MFTSKNPKAYLQAIGTTDLLISLEAGVTDDVSGLAEANFKFKNSNNQIKNSYEQDFWLNLYAEDLYSGTEQNGIYKKGYILYSDPSKTKYYQDLINQNSFDYNVSLQLTVNDVWGNAFYNGDYSFYELGLYDKSGNMSLTPAEQLPSAFGSLGACRT